MAEDTRGKKVWARRPLEYGGLRVAEGEIFALTGHTVDELLLRYRYVVEVERFKKHYEHGATGRKFIEAGYLDKFGRSLTRRASPDVPDVAPGPYGSVMDTTGDAEQRRLDQEAPLDLSR